MALAVLVAVTSLAGRRRQRHQTRSGVTDSLAT